MIGIGILCGLGTWQVQRLEEKTSLLALLDAQKARPARFLSKLSDATPELAFHRVALRGHYFFDKTIALGPRTRNGVVGVHILTPFALEGGEGEVLVNRGWAPEGWEEGRGDALAETVYISGILRRPERANLFVPDNTPESGRWYRIDPGQMAAALGLPRLAPMLLYLEATEEGGNDLPDAMVLSTRPPNNHLTYALFWFAMAGILAAIFALRFGRARP